MLQPFGNEGRGRIMADQITTDSRLDQVFARIEDQRDGLVALTQELIRIPTVNPPGDAYRPCAELIGERLRKQGFSVEYLRAEGAVGDSDRYPRTNVVARIEGERPGETVHFNGHIDVVEAGKGWTFDPFAATVASGRVSGRGSCDLQGGLAASLIAVLGSSSTVDAERRETHFFGRWARDEWGRTGTRFLADHPGGIRAWLAGSEGYEHAQQRFVDELPGWLAEDSPT